uniref:Protein KRI1 homolog n=1 Tax=Lygus hesperus TaxID=30085 RepID=A0A0A9ZG18_LYGHE
MNRLRQDTEKLVLRSLDLAITTNGERSATRWLSSRKKELLEDPTVMELRQLPTEKRREILHTIIDSNVEKLDTMNKEDVRLGTRFNYIQVPENDYGIDIVDILNSTDQELNTKVSLKYLAPYRDDFNAKNWKEVQR